MPLLIQQAAGFGHAYYSRVWSEKEKALCKSIKQLAVVYIQQLPKAFVLADIGAAAYASVMEGCELTTQEILLSMLENDSSFRDLLAKESSAKARQAWMPCHSTWAISKDGIDSWELELAVAGLMSHAEQLDEAATTLVWAKGPKMDLSLDQQPGHLAEGVHMIVPSTSSPVSDLALRIVFKYWGIPCRPCQS